MSQNEQDEMIEDTVEDVEKSDNKFIRYAERVWSHFWFLLLLSAVGVVGYIVYGLVQSGQITLDVSVSADVNLGLPLTILSLALVGFLIFYTYSRYLYLNGEEHTEGLMKKAMRGVSIAMHNYSRDDLEQTLQQEEENEE